MTPLEKVIRPIVEGQIRGFLKEHPSILAAVDWYKVPGRDPAETFVGSLSKRIVRDLASRANEPRLAAALAEIATRPRGEEPPVASSSAGGGAPVGTPCLPGRLLFPVDDERKR